MKICNSHRHQEIAWENASLHEDCPICKLIDDMEEDHDNAVDDLCKEVADLEEEVTQLEGQIKDLEARITC